MTLALRTRAYLGITLLALLYLLWKGLFGGLFGLFSPRQTTSDLADVGSEFRRVELETQRIDLPFLDLNTLRSPHWNIAGDVVIDNYNYVALTSDKPHQAGLLFNKNSFDAESFEMELTFHIHAASKLSADGMAIWLTEKPSSIGEVFGARSNFNGLGIFIDTFRNGPTGHFPYVSAQFSRGGSEYNKDDDGLSTQLGGCTAKSLLNPNSGKTKMKLLYLKNGYLSVQFNYNPDEFDNWHKCFTIYDVDLPRTRYLGFSAETGELSESVELLGNTVHALFESDQDVYIDSPDQVERYAEKAVEEPQDVPTDSRNKHQRRRKSARRVKLTEDRVQQRARARRLEKYGDPDATFVRRCWSKFMKAVKITVALAFLACFGWVVRLVLKTRRQKRRSTRSTGILS